jgi:hypothetical protein
MTASRGKTPKADMIGLWTRAGSLCSFPGCLRELTYGDEAPRLRGEMAHIVASSDVGPRGDPDFPADERNRYANLILLCPNHHQEIDAEESSYDVDALRAMKADHEEWIARQLSKGRDWAEELSSLDYINVPRVLLDPAATGVLDERELNVLADLRTLREMGFALGGVTLALERVIASWEAHAIDLGEPDALGEEDIGARVSFETSFRTKNMTGADKQRPGFELSGNLEKDPHIYVITGERKVYLPLDPRWVTTSTAFVTFTSGIARLAGIGQLRALDGDMAIISPLAIGAPPLRGAAKELDEMLTSRPRSA